MTHAISGIFQNESECCIFLIGLMYSKTAIYFFSSAPNLIFCQAFTYAYIFLLVASDLAWCQYAVRRGLNAMNLT